MLHLRVVEGVLQRVDRPTRHSRVVQDFDPSGGRLRARHLLDVGIQRLPVRDTARRGGILWPLQQLYQSPLDPQVGSALMLFYPAATAASGDTLAQSLVWYEAPI